MVGLSKFSVAVFIIYYLFPIKSHAQFWKSDWQVDISYARQAHDKRLFGWPAEASNRMLAAQPEKFGTNVLGLSVSKMFYQNGRYRAHIGLGVGKEVQTFRRCFEQCFDRPIWEPCWTDIKYIQTYESVHAQIPISQSVAVKNLLISLTILPQINVYKKVNVKSLPLEVTDNKISFYSIEINPQVSYKLGPLEPYIGYRIAQIKKKDNVYLYQNGNGDYKNEWYNPAKWIFGLRLHLGKWDKKVTG